MDSNKAIFRILTYRSMPSVKRFSLIPEAFVVLNCAEDMAFVSDDEIFTCEASLKLALNEKNTPTGVAHLNMALHYLRHLIVGAQMGHAPNDVSLQSESLELLPMWLRDTKPVAPPKERADQFIHLIMDKLALA